MPARHKDIGLVATIYSPYQGRETLGLGAAICSAFFVVCSSAAMAENGIASIYAYAGEKTANGERANPGGLTAAHKTLPFGTRVRGQQAQWQERRRSINDRGPFVRGRIIDLTPAGARALGFNGLAPVSLESTG